MPSRKTSNNHDLLVQTALTVELLNTRLFGGAGQEGAIPYLYEQHNQFSATGFAGFFGATPVSRQTVSGSKAGNAALTSLMAALSALGLVLDTTS